MIVGVVKMPLALVPPVVNPPVVVGLVNRPVVFVPPVLAGFVSVGVVSAALVAVSTPVTFTVGVLTMPVNVGEAMGAFKFIWS